MNVNIEFLRRKYLEDIVLRRTCSLGRAIVIAIASDLGWGGHVHSDTFQSPEKLAVKLVTSVLCDVDENTYTCANEQDRDAFLGAVSVFYQVANPHPSEKLIVKLLKDLGTPKPFIAATVLPMLVGQKRARMTFVALLAQDETMAQKLLTLSDPDLEALVELHYDGMSIDDCMRLAA